MKGAVYNEFDKGAAAWLRELIANNLIAPGDVDERSIKDVSADDYRGYTQVHCFAGIGIWSGALRAARWEDSRPIGSASCPCQSFSLAGKGLGFADPRHLWPDYLRLVDEARQQGQPWASTLIGEQVASAGQWLDLVQSDLEARSYAFAAADIPAAGFEQGAHIRQRFYWVADRDNAERWSDMAGRDVGDWAPTGRIEGYGEPGTGGAAGGVADGASGQSGDGQLQHGGEHRQQQEDGRAVRVGDHYRLGLERGSSAGGQVASRRRYVSERPLGLSGGSLSDAEWVGCADGKWRPVEAGTFPLAASHPGRLGLLRGYGNALDFKAAMNFISAYMEAAEIRDVAAELV